MFRLRLALLCLLCNLVLPGFASERAAVSADGKVAIASVNPLATQAGLQAVARGGNAIDAALAAAFTLGVVDSHNSGIGGGCFIIAHLADGTLLAIDGREMAPAAAHRDMFLREGKVVSELSKTGALAVGVPGSVAALHYLQSSGGRLGFADVILPAARLAETGFQVDTWLARRLAASRETLAKFPASRSIFLHEDGTPFKAGETLRQIDLAASYRALAKEGPDYFYRGDFARRTAVWMKANGGLITEADFADYQLKLRTPVRSRFQGFEIVGFPPPSSGGTMVAEILNILSFFDLATLSEVDRYHVSIEAMKLAFADRAHWMGDADFVKVPKGLLDPTYARALADRIDLAKAMDVPGYSVPPRAQEWLFGKHTTHLATADKAGNWVALTTTLNTSFGSKVVVPGTGVLLNNQMDDFSAQPGVPNAFGLVGAEANSVQPRKRPLSSMSPTLVLQQGKPVFSVGAAGGPTIINQVVHALVQHLALKRPAAEALGTVRVHQQWRPGTVYIDDFAAPALIQALTARGHELKVWPPFGASQAIALEAGRLVPVAEPRLDDGR